MESPLFPSQQFTGDCNCKSVTAVGGGGWKNLTAVKKQNLSTTLRQICVFVIVLFIYLLLTLVIPLLQSS